MHVPNKAGGVPLYTTLKACNYTSPCTFPMLSVCARTYVLALAPGRTVLLEEEREKPFPISVSGILYQGGCIACQLRHRH